MNKKNIVFSITLSVLFSLMGYSQNKMYLKIDGIDGDATDVTHKGWIDILRFENSLSNSVSISSGGGGGAGKVRFGDIIITKLIDKTSPTLITRAASGMHSKEATIEISGTDKTPIYSIRIFEVFITGITSSAECSPNCTTTEILKLSFNKALWEYKDKSGGIIKRGWDIKENRAL